MACGSSCPAALTEAASVPMLCDCQAIASKPGSLGARHSAGFTAGGARRTSRKTRRKSRAAASEKGFMRTMDIFKGSVIAAPSSQTAAAPNDHVREGQDDAAQQDKEAEEEAPARVGYLPPHFTPARFQQGTGSVSASAAARAVRAARASTQDRKPSASPMLPTATLKLPSAGVDVPQRGRPNEKGRHGGAGARAEGAGEGKKAGGDREPGPRGGRRHEPIRGP